MLGELVPVGGGDPIPLLKKKLLVGRRNECDITLRFPNVSSQHCELELVDGYWLVRDLNSSNGIRINGIRFQENWLMPGDELRIAKHKFEVRYSAVGPAPENKALDISTSLMEKAGLGGSGGRDSADNVDMSRGLLEKAGLERGPRRSGTSAPSRPAPRTNPPASTPPKSKPDSDESIALKWLSDL